MRNRELQKASRLPETVHATFWSSHLEPGPGHPALLIVHSLESLIVHLLTSAPWWVIWRILETFLQIQEVSYWGLDRINNMKLRLISLEKSPGRQHDTPLYTRKCWYSGQSVAMNIYLLLRFTGEKGFYCWKINLDEYFRFASCK